MKNIKGETFKTGAKNSSRRFVAAAAASAFTEKYSTAAAPRGKHVPLTLNRATLANRAKANL
jgi:hypothetical protein